MRTIDWSCNCAKCLESRVEGRILARELLEDLIVAEEEADRGRKVDGECRAVDGVCRSVDQKPESGIDPLLSIRFFSDAAQFFVNGVEVVNVAARPVGYGSEPEFAVRLMDTSNLLIATIDAMNALKEGE